MHDGEPRSHSSCTLGGLDLVSKGEKDPAANGENDVMQTAPAPRKPGRNAVAKEADLGNALRSVYQQTVAEQVPPEMLDLLGKLD